MSIPASEAKSRLIEGNKRFINATSNPGDVSLERRVDTLKNGQHPYAIVLCCSDSRQVPEAIFSAGIGELFVIRVAGNVVDSHQLLLPEVSYMNIRLKKLNSDLHIMHALKE